MNDTSILTLENTNDYLINDRYFIQKKNTGYINMIRSVVTR